MLSNDRMHPDYKVVYDHIHLPKFKPYQAIKRGEVIGTAFDYFKMLLYNDYNVQDPDSYGEEHSYMNYMENNRDYNNGENALERRKKQREIIEYIVNQYTGEFNNQILQLSDFNRITCKLFHRSQSEPYEYFWSEIERFRLLESIYRMEPYEFDLNQSGFEIKKKEFYINQPIVLTLPFKKS